MGRSSNNNNNNSLTRVLSAVVLLIGGAVSAQSYDDLSPTYYPPSTPYYSKGGGDTPVYSKGGGKKDAYDGDSGEAPYYSPSKGGGKKSGGDGYGGGGYGGAPVGSPVSPPLKNIVDTLISSDDPSFQVLVTALVVTGLDEVLSDSGPFTLFAPPDEAFGAVEAALPGILECLIDDPDTLSAILRYHVVNGPIASSDLGPFQTVPTGLEGATLDISVVNGKVYISDAATDTDAVVVIPDVEATNGFIHVIDKVLLPFDVSDFYAACVATAPASAPIGMAPYYAKGDGGKKDGEAPAAEAPYYYSKGKKGGEAPAAEAPYYSKGSMMGGKKADGYDMGKGKGAAPTAMAPTAGGTPVMPITPGAPVGPIPTATAPIPAAPVGIAPTAKGGSPTATAPYSSSKGGAGKKGGDDDYDGDAPPSKGGAGKKGDSPVAEAPYYSKGMMGGKKADGYDMGKGASKGASPMMGGKKGDGYKYGDDDDDDGHGMDDDFTDDVIPADDDFTAVDDDSIKAYAVLSQELEQEKEHDTSSSSSSSSSSDSRAKGLTKNAAGIPGMVGILTALALAAFFVVGLMIVRRRRRHERIEIVEIDNHDESSEGRPTSTNEATTSSDPVYYVE